MKKHDKSLFSHLILKKNKNNLGKQLPYPSKKLMGFFKLSQWC